MLKVINELRDLGFSVEMDDFGSGYSSLNMLASMPVDILKIDMKFIRNLKNDDKKIKVLELIINIAKSLSIKVIAEGVETNEQLEILKRLGCDIVQGFFFHKPLEAEIFETLLGEKINNVDFRHA